MNDPSIRETEATVFLGHARGILEVRWGNNSERLDILVPRGRTLEVSVQVDEVTPGDRLGYAAHADLYVSDRLISSELRTRDILVSLQVLALMGCMVAALMRATWIAPIGLTVLAMLPQAYVNNFYLIDDISPWWFFTAGAVGVLHWRLWFVSNRIHD